VRAIVRDWLFRLLFDPLVGDLTLRVRACYPRLRSPDGVVSKAWLRARAWWFSDARKAVVNPMGWLMNATGYASRDGSSVMGRRFVPPPGDSDGGFDPFDPDAGRPDVRAEEAELADRLEVARSQLPADDRTLLELKFDEQLSQDELASALGVSDRTVRRHYSTLIDTLRTMLNVGPGETRT
jgi:RNA polymerase sigma factor (sigma-70 family)